MLNKLDVYQYPVSAGVARERNIAHIKSCIASCSNLFGVNQSLLKAIIWQESTVETLATRFEPGFYSLYIADASKTKLRGDWPETITETTERRARATSWGLMQIMGQTARELGYKGLLTGLVYPEVGLFWATAYLSRKIGALGMELGIRAYNGDVESPRTAEYLQKIQSHLQLKPYKNLLGE